MKTLVFPYESFTREKIVGAVIALAFGLVLLDDNLVLAVMFFVLAIYLTFISDGLEIDLENTRYRYFNARFGLRTGRWNSFKSYTQILILLKRRQKELVGARSAVTTYLDHEAYEVVTADTSHRKQLLLGSFESKEAAERFAEAVSEQLNQTIAKFNPTISRASRERINREKRRVR